MKYLKYFELSRTGTQFDYEVGDIVMCIKTQTVTCVEDGKLTGTKDILTNGKKYEVIKIYKTPEDIFLKKPYMRVDVKDLITGEITKGWESNIFKIELEYFSDLYNL